jgi:hypothetical protein
MLPLNLLSKVRSVTLIAAIAACGTAMGADEPAEKRVLKASIDAAQEEPLTTDQLALVKTTIPKLGAEKFEDRQKASETLTALGKPVVPALREALKEQKDEEIASRLNTIIKKFTEPAKPETVQCMDPCPACGRG